MTVWVCECVGEICSSAGSTTLVSETGWGNIHPTSWNNAFYLWIVGRWVFYWVWSSWCKRLKFLLWCLVSLSSHGWLNTWVNTRPRKMEAEFTLRWKLPESWNRQKHTRWTNAPINYVPHSPHTGMGGDKRRIDLHICLLPPPLVQWPIVR